MKQKAIDVIASPLLQLTFVAVAAAAYLLQAANLYTISAGLYGSLFQATYSDGLQLSQFGFIALQGILFPPLLFVIALALLARRKGWLTKLFQASLLTQMALLLQVSITQIRTFVYELYPVPVTDFAFFLIHAIEIGLILAIFIAFLVNLRKSRTNSQAVQPVVKKSLVALLAVSVITGAAVIAYRVIKQYPTNPNLSGFLSISLITVMIPALLFGISYWISGKGLNKLDRSFVATVFTILGLLLLSVIHYGVRVISPEIYGSFEGYWPGVMFDFSLMLTGAVLSVGLLIYLRKQLALNSK